MYGYIGWSGNEEVVAETNGGKPWKTQDGLSGTYAKWIPPKSGPFSASDIMYDLGEVIFTLFLFQYTPHGLEKSFKTVIQVEVFWGVKP